METISHKFTILHEEKELQVWKIPDFIREKGIARNDIQYLSNAKLAIKGRETKPMRSVIVDNVLDRPTSTTIKDFVVLCNGQYLKLKSINDFAKSKGVSHQYIRQQMERDEHQVVRFVYGNKYINFIVTETVKRKQNASK